VGEGVLVTPTVDAEAMGAFALDPELAGGGGQRVWVLRIVGSARGTLKF
jgi:hypothetical protein